MKKINLLFLGMVMIIFSSNILAAGWSSATKVTQVYAASGGDIYMQFESMLDEGCGITSWIRLLPSHSNFKMISAQSLMAQAVNADVVYYVSGCAGSYTKLTNFRTITP